MSNVKMNEWNDWGKAPDNGQTVDVQLPGGIFTGVYFDDGVDGIIEWDGGDIMEIEEHAHESSWRLHVEHAS